MLNETPMLDEWGKYTLTLEIDGKEYAIGVVVGERDEYDMVWQKLKGLAVAGLREWMERQTDE